MKNIWLLSVFVLIHRQPHISFPGWRWTRVCHVSTKNQWFLLSLFIIASNKAHIVLKAWDFIIDLIYLLHVYTRKSAFLDVKCFKLCTQNSSKLAEYIDSTDVGAKANNSIWKLKKKLQQIKCTQFSNVITMCPQMSRNVCTLCLPAVIKNPFLQPCSCSGYIKNKLSIYQSLTECISIVYVKSYNNSDSIVV